jgi:uncharacterized protein DUF6308
VAIGETIDLFLDPREIAVELVREYVATDENGQSRYTGACFERLGGGGDRPDVANRFTAEDVVAVTMLSVSVPPRTALWMLDVGSEQLSQFLRGIPTDVDLFAADKKLIDDDSPADQLWRLLKSRHGIQWVTAGKLLARKRPRLIPVYDDVVRLALGAPGSYWTSLWEAFRDGDRLRIPLEEIRSAADVEWMSLLRVLDVVIWMRNRGKKDARDNELRNLAPILPE